MPTLSISQTFGKLARTLQTSQAALHRFMIAAGTKAGKKAVMLYRRTTSNWEHRPEFIYTVEASGTVVVMEAGTNDEIYTYVDLGTRPHTITPRGPWMLRFQEGYKPKTKPGALRSGRGGPTGAFVRAKSVEHPGIKPRGFTKRIPKFLDLGRVFNESVEDWANTTWR